MNKRLSIAVAMFLVFIAVVSVAFHYPVQIIYALTLKPVPGFDVKVHLWRILFEPFFGPLLFLNRGLYAIDEMLLSVWWVVILFLLYSIYRYFKFKDASKRKKFLLSQLVNLPIAIGLWFTYFLIAIFMSAYLPSNTIVNNTKNWILVTTHSHSQFSHDGLISEQGLWEWHKYNNFDAFFITDHNNHNYTLDFVKAQRDGKFPMDPLVMGGEEFSGTNHLSLLGLKSNFSTHGKSDSAVIALTRKDGGAVIVNHWFDGEHKTLEYYRDLGVDGFEIENSAVNTSYDRKVYKKIRNFCESNGLIMNGGLDFHGYGNVCSLWNAMEIPGWHNMSPGEKEQAIIDVIRSRDQSKLQVLLYNDRPYYPEENLFWMIPVHLFNYLRTLNFWQVLSWAVWGFLFLLLMRQTSQTEVKRFNANKIVAVIGVLSSLFMLGLALAYYLETFDVAGSDNDIYIEYAGMLLWIGGAFLIYSGVVAWFRVRKKG